MDHLCKKCGVNPKNGKKSWCKSCFECQKDTAMDGSNLCHDFNKMSLIHSNGKTCKNCKVKIDKTVDWCGRCSDLIQQYGLCKNCRARESRVHGQINEICQLCYQGYQGYGQPCIPVGPNIPIYQPIKLDYQLWMDIRSSYCAPSYSNLEDRDWQPDDYKVEIIMKGLTEDIKNILKTPFNKWKAQNRLLCPCNIEQPIDIQSTTTWATLSGNQQPLSQIISLHKGSVTTIDCDAIVNAANERCMGGMGVDGEVHKVAGELLMKECATFNGCGKGHARITKGYGLPAKFIIHTVGPQNEKGWENTLKHCYNRSLELLKSHGLRTIAFCCIGVGIFGCELEMATKIALMSVRHWLSNVENSRHVSRICFVCFTDEEYGSYMKLLPNYFSG